MRAVIQRVRHAEVLINGSERRHIGAGLVVLLGVEERDSTADGEWLAGKIARLRIFGDDAGLMNRSVQEVGGEIMVISQFTLFASTKKGNRPSFTRSAKPEQAIPLYHQFLVRLEVELSRPVVRGEFGADMLVSLANDGPVTIWMDSQDPE